jgi:hypothetical protein
VIEIHEKALRENPIVLQQQYISALQIPLAEFGGTIAEMWGDRMTSTYTNSHLKGSGNGIHPLPPQGLRGAW